MTSGLSHWIVFTYFGVKSFCIEAEIGNVWLCYSHVKITARVYLLISLFSSTFSLFNVKH